MIFREKHSIGVESGLQFTWIVIRKVIFVVLHAVQCYSPYFILLIFPSEETGKFLLDTLCSIVKEDHRIIENGPLMCNLCVDSLDISQFFHNVIFVLTESRVRNRLSKGNFVDESEILERIVLSELFSFHLHALTTVYLFGPKGTINHLLSYGYEMQSRTEKTRMLCLAMLARVNLELIHNVL